MSVPVATRRAVAAIFIGVCISFVIFINACEPPRPGPCRDSIVQLIDVRDEFHCLAGSTLSTETVGGRGVVLCRCPDGGAP